MSHYSVLFKIIQDTPGARSTFMSPVEIFKCFKLYLQNGATVSILLRISSTIKSEIVNASSDILSLSPFLESRQMREVEKFKSRVQCVPSNSSATQTHINTY